MPALPRLSIVTPSYNQAAYLGETMRSVLEQNYPNIEYVVIDGGSTDGSVDIIKKYADKLAYWTSEPDRGQYDAINKGFARTSGEIMAWLNSDDQYAPWAFSVVADVFRTFPEVEWITAIHPVVWNEEGQPVFINHLGGFSRESFWKGANLPRRKWFARSWIQQESTFWRRSLWERAGSQVDATLRYAGDFELWTRFYQQAELYGVVSMLGGFRIHGNQKTAVALDSYLAEAERAFFNRGGRPYSRLETLLRRGMVKVKPFTVNRPPRLARLVPRLFTEVRVIEYLIPERKWEMRTRYVI